MKLAAPVRHGRTPARLARPFRAGATSRRSIGVIWLSAVRKGWIAGFSWPFEDHRQYPVEVLNRAADIFRMAGHMLGQRLPLRLGLVVSSVDDGTQTFPLRRN